MAKKDKQTLLGATETVEIYRPIGEGVDKQTGIPYLSSDEMSWQIKQRLENGAAALELKIDCPGGDYSNSMAIFNMLRECPIPTTAKAMGLVASGASIVAMGCKRFIMLPGSMLMIHEANSLPQDPCSADDLEKYAAITRQRNEQAAKVYMMCNRKGITLQQVMDMMAEESWMTPEEALALGFCDEAPVDPAVKSVAYAIPESFGYKHIPSFMRTTRLFAGGNNTEVQKMHEKTKAFFSELFKRFGLSGEYDPEKFDHASMLTKIDTMQAENKAGVEKLKSFDEVLKALGAAPGDSLDAVKGRIDAMNAAPATASAEVDELKAQLAAKDRDLLIEKHVRLGLNAATIKAFEGKSLDYIKSHLEVLKARGVLKDVSSMRADNGGTTSAPGDEKADADALKAAGITTEQRASVLESFKGNESVMNYYAALPGLTEKALFIQGQIRAAASRAKGGM